MKKILLSVAMVATFGTAFAQKLTFVPYNVPGKETAVLMGEAVSPNGRYVSGGDGEKGFICDMTTGETKFFKSEFLGDDGVNDDAVDAVVSCVGDDGVGYGYMENCAAKFDFESGKWTKIGSDNSAVKFANADQTVLCGHTYEGYYPSAVYWDADCNLHELPTPTPEWLGFDASGFSATQVSADGSTIVGYAVDDMATNPLIVWHRNTDGSYSVDPVCKPYFNGAYDAWQKYDSFNADCISANGKWAAINVHDLNEANDYEDEGMYWARYDLEADTVQFINCPDHSASLYFYANGISNDGTIIGYTEDDARGRIGVICKAGENTVQYLSDAYPTVKEISEMDINQLNVPCSITPDGRYIEGFGYVDSPLEENQVWYATWLLDTGESTAIDNAVATNTASKVVASYSIDGKKLNSKSSLKNRVVVNRLANGKAVKNVVK